METMEKSTIACPKCRRSCDWKAEFVGKVAQCPCGHVMKIPPLAGGDGSGSGDQSALRFHVPAPPRRLNTLPEDGPIPAAQDCLLDDQTEKELAALGKYGEEHGLKADPFRDLHAPLALILFGCMLVGAEITWHVNSGRALAGTAIFVLAGLLVHVATMFGGILLAARFGGVNFGPLGTAILKLAAIYLAPSTLGSLITELLGGDMAVACIGWGVAVILYWSLISYLFRLDGAQTATCVFAIAGARYVTSALIIGLLFAGLTLSPPGDSLASDDETAPAMMEESAEVELDEEGF